LQGILRRVRFKLPQMGGFQVERNALSFSPEFGQQILQRIADGQRPEEVARQLGHTPATIGYCLSVMEEGAPTPSQRMSFAQRATAWRNELAASLVSPRESRYVAAITRELLKLHWIVSASHPGLARRDIYRRIVMVRSGADEDEANLLLRRAEQSFATWPTPRELTFADVVHYIAVSEYLQGDDRIGTRINMGRLIAGRVPADL
jgi:transposase-like protein